MLNTEENLGTLGEFQTPESQNIVDANHSSNYISENNNNEDDVFDEITPLDTNTTSGDGVFGYSNEWASALGDDRDGGVSGSIAERRAATCGFNAGGFSGPTINVARLRSDSPFSSPITIPAGISPTELLDSPVMLRSSQAQPSPTTGTFQLSPLHRESVVLDSTTPATDGGRETDDVSPFQSQLRENHVSLTSMLSMGSKGFELPEFPMGIKNSGTELLADFDDSKMRTDHVASQPCLEGYQQGSSSSAALPKTSGDSYNWRKYGQKKVKGSEFPRSYYRCGYPNCLVKKMVERYRDGEVAKIIYKGTHNHLWPQPQPQPQPCSEDGVGGGGGIIWRKIEPGGDFKNTQNENLEALSTTQMKSLELCEVGGSHEPLCKPNEDLAPLDGKSIEDYSYLNESESKRRKIDLPVPETRVVSRGVREPKVVVQIESEVDILDDGYKWRKYGQKVVKGNPNPRSYYKCTSFKCPVRKHVERACDNLKFVITTYEGKHDHELPVPKTAAVSGATARTQPAYAMPRINTNAPISDPQFQKLPDFSLLENFGTHMYPLNIPNLKSQMTYGYDRVPNFHMPLLYGVPRPPILMPAEVDIYNMAAPLQSSVEGQEPKENDLGLVKPKQEDM